MGKKCILVVFLTILIFGVSSAYATPVLFDWYIDVNGSFNQAVGTYLPPTVGGDITGVSGFSMFTPTGDPYGYDVPNALGSVTATFNPGAAGTYNIEGFFDVEIDEWDNTWYNESGSAVGSSAPGQYGYADDFFGDISWYMGWDFTLAANQTAVATFNTSSTVPSGFYLTQTDNDTGETIYLSSSLNISGGGTSVPDAGIMLLLSTALGGLGALEIKKLFMNKAA